MPKTKFQKLIFGVMMALVMVYGMEVYNASLRNGGLSGSSFAVPIGEIAAMGVLVIVLESILAGPLARKIAFLIVDARDNREIVVILAVSVATVCLMCPLMSLAATIIFHGFGSMMPITWLHTVLWNFPMAFCWQLLIAGPAVRFAFKRMFKRQLCGCKAKVNTI
ncbi:DUF2798 domain-containing protein [Anaerovorax odorimutans]|uniref:DUF2798 domain-containing protein n=1 Tax=Anaerovorax odorimutans TaxID=109327 RepID=A0ABT1RM21_9FIRM|nr:DUF2798 domain-containing protein [Anaerovorax odorimutans]MCQ4636245.1 DUF2798 domain-containing protein [Anaerovorax odorimutans]